MNYDYYLARMKGERPKWSEVADPATGSGGPQLGLFRHPNGQPARIRRDNETGELEASIGDEIISAEKLWPLVAESCVSKADYLHRINTGSWPGEEREEPAAVAAAADLHGKAGHNSGDTSADSEAALATAATLISQAEELLLSASAGERTQMLGDCDTLLLDANKLIKDNKKDGIPPGAKATADRMKNLSDSLKAKRIRLDEMRISAKRLFDGASDRVHRTYKPTVDALDTATKGLLFIVDSFGRMEEKRLAAEASRAAADAKAKAEAAQVTNPLSEVAPITAEAVRQPAALSFGSGRKRHVRKPVLVAEITDWKEALADELVSENEKVRAAVQALANTLAGVRAEKPWFKIKEV